MKTLRSRLQARNAWHMVSGIAYEIAFTVLIVLAAAALCLFWWSLAQ